MADPSWTEAVGGGIAALLAGAGATFKAMKIRANGHSPGWHTFDKRVSFLERDYAEIKATLGKHDGKLDDIRGDLSRIMAAVDRRND